MTGAKSLISLRQQDGKWVTSGDGMDRISTAAEVELWAKAQAYNRIMGRLIGKHEYDTLCVADIRATLDGVIAKL